MYELELYLRCSEGLNWMLEETEFEEAESVGVIIEGWAETYRDYEHKIVMEYKL